MEFQSEQDCATEIHVAKGLAVFKEHQYTVLCMVQNDKHYE